MVILEVPSFNYTPSTHISNMTEEINTDSTTPPDDERHVRQRIINGYGLLPYDSSVRIPTSVVEVDIEHMLSKNPERKRVIMYLQLIRIVSGSNSGQTNPSNF